jgi:hypothetical protein
LVMVASKPQRKRLLSMVARRNDFI